MKASEYKKHARSKRAKSKLHEVTVPSGAVWKLLEPPIEQFIIAGKMPASLAAKMATAARSGAAAEEEAEHLTPDDLLNNLIFGRDLLLYCAVEPRVKLDADPDSETEIAPEDILPEDFDFLISWVVTGGGSGESLSTFRSK